MASIQQRPVASRAPAYARNGAPSDGESADDLRLRESGEGATESEEVGGEESSYPTTEAGDQEAGQEETEAAGDHSPVANQVSAAPSGGGSASSSASLDEGGDEGFLDVVGGLVGGLLGGEAAESAEAAETEFEAAEGWDESAASEQEAGEGEALVDAYFGSNNEQGNQEFFGALIPVFKFLAPVLINQLGKLGGAAVQRLSAQARARLVQRTRTQVRRESEGGEASEADIEALLESLTTLESVIGPDDRVRISPCNRVPWERIAHLQIKPAVGSGFYSGTGFLVGPRTLLTAGHCVFLHGAGGWAREIMVTPARDGADKPIPTRKAVQFRSVRGWTIGKKRICDYGAIIMPRGWSMPRPTAFAYGVLPDSAVSGSKLNLAGYPADKQPKGSMWYHGRAGARATQNVIFYQNDSFGGQSGSPVWIKRRGKRVVVGIHTNGGTDANSATRITRDVYANIDRWRAEGGA